MSRIEMLWRASSVSFFGLREQRCVGPLNRIVLQPAELHLVKGFILLRRIEVVTVDLSVSNLRWKQIKRFTAKIYQLADNRQPVPNAFTASTILEPVIRCPASCLVERRTISCDVTDRRKQEVTSWSSLAVQKIVQSSNHQCADLSGNHKDLSSKFW